MNTFEKMFKRYDEISYDLMMERLKEVSWEQMTLHHMKYLEVIYRLGNPTISQISDDLGFTKPSVTIMINRLMQEGIVEKHQSADDKRVFTVMLTKRGREIINIERDAFQTLFESICAKLSSKDQEQLMQLLEKGM